MRHAARPFDYLVSVIRFSLHVMTQQYVFGSLKYKLNRDA
jgi:hypothetical protein